MEHLAIALEPEPVITTTDDLARHCNQCSSPYDTLVRSQMDTAHKADRTHHLLH
jgi:hypothetical protein